MTFIYSFLQKRKMHENQHGIVMVVIAYALSIMLLVLGSDVFYNIKSAAADMDADTEETTQQFIVSDTGLQDEDELSPAIRSSLLNPYGIDEMAEEAKAVPETKNSPYRTDTVWFLGVTTDSSSYDTMMEKMTSYIAETSSSKETSTTEMASIASETGAGTEEDLESFSVEVAASDSVITVSAEEVTMLERIVAAEAEGEDMVGKILIANVIFNRIADEEFPDTVEEVIFQKSHGDYQFSPVDNGRYWSVDISDETVEAVQRALDGEDYSEGALYFIARKRTTSSSAKWFDRNLDWLFEHGGHEFYK